MSGVSTAEEIGNDGFLYGEYGVVKILIHANVDYYNKNKGVFRKTTYVVWKGGIYRSLYPLATASLGYDGK